MRFKEEREDLICGKNNYFEKIKVDLIEDLIEKREGGFRKIAPNE